MLERTLVHREKYKSWVRSLRWHWKAVHTKSNYVSEKLPHSNFRLVFSRFTFSTYVHHCLQIHTVSNSSFFSCLWCQISKPDKWNPVFQVGRLKVIKNFSFISCHKTCLPPPPPKKTSFILCFQCYWYYTFWICLNLIMWHLHRTMQNTIYNSN